MKIIPFWKLQTKNQVGLDIGFTLTKFDYMAGRDIYELQIDLLLFRIIITL